MAGLAYVGEKNAGTHLFHFLADGDRPVLEIYVDVKNTTDMDAELPIYINGVGKPMSDRQITKGLTRLTIIESGTSDTEVPSGIMIIPDMRYIAIYVIERVHTLMARVYVPKDITEG